MDLPLSEMGRQQALAASRALERRPINAIFSSPLRRALQTAQLIADSHNLAVQTVEALTECDVGVWEGLNWADIQRRDAEAFRAFEENPASTPYAGGESFQDVQDRAVPALQQLLNASSGDVVVVLHNIVGRVVLAKTIGIATSKSRSIHLDNAGISILSVQNGESKMITLNSVLHLDGLMTPP